jgi:MinD superfamily P-loop ATPase
LVTEPTPFGVVINRCDIGDDKVKSYCKESNIPILTRIPFDRKIAEYYSNGTPLIEGIHEYADKFRALFGSIRKELEK